MRTQFRRDMGHTVRLLRAPGAAAIVLMFALAGCAGGAPGGEAAGAPRADTPVKSLAKAVNFATDVSEPKDFVMKSRPADDKLQFIPVHARPPARTEAVLSPDGVKLRERELEAVRRQHDRISGRPSSDVKIAAKPKAKSVKPVDPLSGK